ncbi:hypothetical protein DPEC_G00054530 [Dallia pectoralis]|uniref:Uncharacterized protein n=1 Tax=Dallia pectoralis TaxID=75939 RepID=A0ACC2H5B4_DALPE|nr:hypothetical protein DPEC_G00054530 [Dallia pectoralis]
MHREQPDLQQQLHLERGVHLKPFLHQVSGHSCVLRYGDRTICKLLVPQEFQFYKNIPSTLEKFIPQFTGVVSVRFDEDLEGSICVQAFPLHSDSGVGDINTDWTLNTQMNSNLLKEQLSDNSFLDPKNGKNKSPGHDEQEVTCEKEVLLDDSNPPQHNPWRLHFQQSQLQKMKDNAKKHNQDKFLLLEDLTWRCMFPCVLDLKMGTRHWRQHGDNVTGDGVLVPSCQQSSSASVGVRHCGMQVYNSDSGQFLFVDKYVGRKLTRSGLKEALFQFFHDGRRLRHHLLPMVLRRLRELQTALEGCDSCRFYSSSLLIIYDGHQDEEDGVNEEKEDDGADVFEISRSSTPSSSISGCQRTHSDEDPDPAVDVRMIDPEEGPDPAVDVRIDPEEGPDPAVDVRMIDFAHTVCPDYLDDSRVLQGPDTGYLFGLQNLITIISQLQRIGKH